MVLCEWPTELYKSEHLRRSHSWKQRKTKKKLHLPGFESYPTTQYMMQLSRNAMRKEYGIRSRVVGMAYAQPG